MPFAEPSRILEPAPARQTDWSAESICPGYHRHGERRIRVGHGLERPAASAVVQQRLLRRMQRAERHRLPPPQRGRPARTRRAPGPADFAEQCRIAWANVEAVLRGAGMTLANLVKMTTFLSDRQYRSANARIREEILCGHNETLTVIITGIYDPRWLLEIEAIAAA
jgi:hypothetical protein